MGVVAGVDDAVADADVRGLPQMLIAKRGPPINIAELFRPFAPLSFFIGSRWVV